MARDIPEVFLVRMVLMAWGIKEVVVHPAATRPIMVMMSICNGGVPVFMRMQIKAIILQIPRVKNQGLEE